MPEAIPKVKGGPRDRLAEIVRAKRDEVRALLPRIAELRERARDASPARDLANALRSPSEVRLLAEVKRRSPSAGVIRPDLDPAEVARGYESGGAAGISVLTDTGFFGGSNADLAAVRSATSLPVLRKDFTVDASQVWEARAIGADAVLLIARILDDGQLADLAGLAGDLGMSVLVEVHDEAELGRAIASGAGLIGINSRDLATFRTDLGVCERLAAMVPADRTTVGESGINTRADVERLARAGVDAVLVGESLMRQPDVSAAARELAGVPKPEAE